MNSTSRSDRISFFFFHTGGGSKLEMRVTMPCIYMQTFSIGPGLIIRLCKISVAPVKLDLVVLLGMPSFLILKTSRQIPSFLPKE